VVLFARPAELFPDLQDYGLYEKVILACIITTAGPIARQLTRENVCLFPITLCVIGLFFSVVLSQFFRFAVSDLISSGVEFFKIVVYYLVFVGTVSSIQRYRWFIGSLPLLILLVAVLAISQYHGWINFEALEAYAQKEFDRYGEVLNIIPRLRGAGIFHDPNDLCVILVIGSAFCLYWLREQSLGIMRFAWLLPLGVFGYGITLTHSRGGFMALAAGMFVLLKSKIGWMRACLLLLTGLFLLLVVSDGRQLRFALDDSEDTSQYRIRLWSDGLVLLQGSPLFGIGQGMYEERAGQSAHNSFLQAYTELGFLGGSLFFGAFLYIFWVHARLNRHFPPDVSPQLRRFQPYLEMSVAALVVGFLSLSRVYSLPTYLILGLHTAYFRFIAAASPGTIPRLQTALLMRALGYSALCLLAIRIFTGAMVRWQ
jgi:hypothetical protein